MWSDKYRPQNISDMLGNEDSRSSIIEWFTKWKKGTKPLLLVGPPGIGKTTIAYLTAKQFGGIVENSDKREYGRAILKVLQKDALLNDVVETSTVWMSHADTIKKLPDGFEILGNTETIPIAAFKATEPENRVYGLQFHPEVYHSAEGKKILKNFIIDICGCMPDWTPSHFITDTVDLLKKQIGDKKVIMAFSGSGDCNLGRVSVAQYGS